MATAVKRRSHDELTEFVLRGFVEPRGGKVRFAAWQQATSPLLAGFTVDVAEVFDAD
jgi:hypothetical protein